MLKSGIYKIVNNINGKIYIGQSVDIRKRFGAHRRNCKYEYKNNHLYNAINKYGISNFTFSVIATIPEYALDHYEKQYIKYYNTMDRECGYNKVDGGGDAKPSIETRKKMSDAKKGKPSKLKGIKRSEETISRMSKALTGRKYDRHSGYKCKSKGYLLDNIEFNNLSEITSYLHISRVTLHKRIRSGLLVIERGIV